MSQSIDPLLSAVSLMLAAFGFFYETQRERIDNAAADEAVPDDPNEKARKRGTMKSTRNVAWIFAGVALAVWLLLMPQIISEVEDALKVNLDLSAYSTPEAIFFVAANAWLVAAGFLFKRGLDVGKRFKGLA